MKIFDLEVEKNSQIFVMTIAHCYPFYLFSVTLDTHILQLYELSFVQMYRIMQLQKKDNNFSSCFKK
jgi:hypothetical protein